MVVTPSGIGVSRAGLVGALAEDAVGRVSQAAVKAAVTQSAATSDAARRCRLVFLTAGPVARELVTVIDTP
jgi:hypothetical protein